MTDVGKRRGGGGFTNQGARPGGKEGLAAERMVGEDGLQRFPNLEVLDGADGREKGLETALLTWWMLMELGAWGWPGLACRCAVWSRSRCNMAEGTVS
jgi:hypothetical protein